MNRQTCQCILIKLILGGTLTVSHVGAIGAGDFVSPVLVPGGRIVIVAIGRAKWVWDVDKGRWKGRM